MPKTILDIEPNKDNSLIDLGNNDFVNVKLFQSVYNQITGKSEKITQYFKDSIEVSAEDLRQLDVKIKQIFGQYAIMEENSSVTVYHIDDCKQEFSSFPRFQAYDQSILSPTETIRIQYNFLIILPDINKP